MKLSEKEKLMISGEMGEGTRQAMSIVVKFGELYNAERLISVKNAHIDAGAFSTIWDSGLDFVENLVANGAKVAVPTTINPCSCDEGNKLLPKQSKEFVYKAIRLKKAFISLGVCPTWTCAPYECTSSVSFGEVVSWSESNAVNYLNSVLGARSNRLPDLVDVCCAVTGRIPEFGLVLEENRAGQLLFDLQGFGPEYFRDYSDYAVIGYLVGEISTNRIPVIKGFPLETTKNQLKTFSAATASSGSVALFHAVGLTPEATTVERAFQGRREYETFVITPKEFAETKKRLNTGNVNEFDSGIVILGCPHLSFAEVCEVHALMKGRKVAAGKLFWIQTSKTVYRLLEDTCKLNELKDAGIIFMCDTCVLELDPDTQWPFGIVATNSGKLAQYLPGMCNSKIILCSTAECVKLIVEG
ncbi:MAG: aconitase X catalytic domain-containing protein [Synergistaceae bacterium]|nr:aconitase X catalytic domain-containing protein [Synergistaceae bacterium]